MSTIVANRVEELHKLAQGAARRVAASWPEVVEADDLAQEVVIRLLESPGAHDRIFEEAEATQKAFFIKVAHQLASEMFQDYERFSGNYTYDTATVRALLEGGAILAEPDRFTPEIVDVREALGNLSESGSNYYAEIVNRFVHEIIPTDGTARRRLNRAIEAITAQMNRIGAERRKNYTEGPGTRLVVTNLQGLNLSKEGYEDAR